ncbi:hypothetical protein LEP1GSC058_1336 [Leptospira fainei serovar Hurstbridge str. BUT 6]|uniref:Uncharacterized protein n=1 Tax=Leptospira fainei serovar Hurstbridge str. BUT 6 TaxID=1193011 RepID=S3W8Y1_9LEPT|nr:hypothetical protein LEP1GSC058_1336 [Leptospira fainei serovar Hurstbridge str. BUT 6]
MPLQIPLYYLDLPYREKRFKSKLNRFGRFIRVFLPEFTEKSPQTRINSGKTRLRKAGQEAAAIS